MPKLLSLLLCFAMVFSLLALPAQAAKADASSVDGTYTGTGTGRNGDITLSVTIADGKITQIENISNKETPKYWAEAVKLFDSILAANGTDGVDAVSGATLSSDGILAAVDDALAKASSQLSGSGTEADPYLVSTMQQLRAVAAVVNGGDDFSGKFIEHGTSRPHSTAHVNTCRIRKAFRCRNLSDNRQSIRCNTSKPFIKSSRVSFS